MLESVDFLNVGKDNLKRILIRDDLKVQKEIHIFDALIRWAQNLIYSFISNIQKF